MPFNTIGYRDESEFDRVKSNYESALKSQRQHLRATKCPIIGVSCIGCDCTAYREPIPPKKHLTGECWIEQWIFKKLGIPFVEPYMVFSRIARCEKHVF